MRQESRKEAIWLRSFVRACRKKGLRGIFGWARGSDDAGRLTEHVALTIKMIIA
jgi:hypothetical protein